MISHATCAFCGITSVNVNTIEFSMTLQLDENGETPANRCSKPSACGVPPNTASICGTLPGSVSVIATSNGANISRRHVTVLPHRSELAFHGGTETCVVTSEDRLMRASFAPGVSVTPF